jgi:ribosomal protein L6P/L9E
LSKYIDTSSLFFFIKRQFNRSHSSLTLLYIRPGFKFFYGGDLKTSPRSFYSWLDYLVFGFFKGYKTYLDIRGTGYKLRLVTNLTLFGIIVRLGYSHLIHINLLKSFRAFFSSRLCLTFFSSNLWELHNKVYSLTVQKKKNAYKGKGIFWKGLVPKLKKSTKLRF